MIPTTQLMTGDICACPDLTEELTVGQIDLDLVQYRCDIYWTAGWPLSFPHTLPSEQDENRVVGYMGLCS